MLSYIFLSYGDIFHYAVDSNTDLDTSILNLLNWDDDVLHLREKIKI